MSFVNCSLSELGLLSPGDPPQEGMANIIDNHALINGVSLPSHVIEELRLLGIPLSSYSGGELQDAIIACAYDRHLVDDPNGAHFRDMLTLTYTEKVKQERLKAATPEEEESPCGLYSCN